METLDPDNIQKMFKELENAKGLTTYELEFLESASDWFQHYGDLRPGNQLILQRIHKEKA